MKKQAYSDELANVVHQFLTDDDWHYSFDSEEGVFNFGVSVKSKLRKIRYMIRVKMDEIIVYGYCPIGADPKDGEVMAKLAEFFCRANYGLKNGNFEFDFRDGEIRFKSYIDSEATLPSAEVVKNSIYCTAIMYDRYADGITSILFAGASAKEAIVKCEIDPLETLQRMLTEPGDNADSDDLGSMITRLARQFGIADNGGDSGDDIDSLEDNEDTYADDTDSSADDDADIFGDLFD